MKEKETEYTRKIQTYSKSTMGKIIHLMNSESQFLKIREIVLESKSEQEVIEKLNFL